MQYLLLERGIKSLGFTPIKKGIMQLTERIQNLHEALTDSERRLAEALLREPDAGAFESLRQFAAKVGVNPSTLSRFAGKLGYARYRDLQMELREIVTRLNSSPVERAKNEPTQTQLAAVLQRSVEEDIDQIRQLHGGASVPLMEEAARLLAETKGTIYVVGNGWNRGLADLIAHRLALCHSRVESSSSLDLLGLGKLAQAGSKDTAVVIVTRRYSRRSLDLASAMHARGIRIIGVTDSPASPLLRMTTVPLVVSTTRGGLFDSPTPLTSVLHALCAGVAHIAASGTVERMKLVDGLNEDLSVFVDQG